MFSLKGIEILLNEIKEKRERAEKKAHNKTIGYAPKCKVCNSEYLNEIEELREDGFTYEEILKELEIDNISIMSLSRHFQNHYPNSQAYKDKQQLEALENIREAYLQYPFLENYFKNRKLEELETFNKEYGFCTDTFELCEYIPAGTVFNCSECVTHLFVKANTEIDIKKQKSYLYNNEDTNTINVNYLRQITNCLSCKDMVTDERISLLEKIITYNFLNIAPENKELYYNLLQFDGNPEEFIQTLEEVNTENQPAK